MRKEITVSIGYMDFCFDNIDKAVSFAEEAVKTIEKKKDRDVRIEIKFYNDDDKEEK